MMVKRSASLRYPLGKLEYKYDERTLQISEFIDPEFWFPPSYDFDKDRRSFPVTSWGNTLWGNCVIASRANHLLRLERIEQRRTVKLKDYHVIDKYKELTGSLNPGDTFDQGLVVLDTLKDWRNNGWHLDLIRKHLSQHKIYKIAAFGELNPLDKVQLRRACFYLFGIQMGFWLPLSAQTQTSQGYWDIVESSPYSKPGSWGGHLVYAKKYDTDNFYVLTWGKEIRVTNAFIEKYCDEAWAIVDDFDFWRDKPTIQVDKMIKYLTNIGATKR